MDVFAQSLSLCPAGPPGAQWGGRGRGLRPVSPLSKVPHARRTNRVCVGGGGRSGTVSNDVRRVSTLTQLKNSVWVPPPVCQHVSCITSASEAGVCANVLKERHFNP